VKPLIPLTPSVRTPAIVAELAVMTNVLAPSTHATACCVRPVMRGCCSVAEIWSPPATGVSVIFASEIVTLSTNACA
jgi:hypothetical protein